ncbi:MAG TPA: M28 family peptidase [Gemmatimonadaceae bacterium]|jgi:Zn-dependent M28 family amino/carboxypeptidase|nr:M28 family peptidase [Gemmatimonadaceae bacterium]
MIVLAFLFLATACGGDSQKGSAAQPAAGSASISTTFSGSAAYDYAKAQVEFGPRVPGTPAAKKAGDWIISQMRARADTVIVQSFTYTTADKKKLPLRNILARFRPELKERILYLTHWDSRPISESAATEAERKMPVPGANDGASGVGMFIALGDVLKKQKPNVGVDLLFTDGEDYGQFGPPEVDVLIGAKYFATHLPSPDYKPLFGVLWDMIGDKDLRIPYEMLSFQQAPEVVSRVWQTAADLGYANIFVQESGGEVIDDHVPLLNAGMHVIDVIDLTYPPHHTPQDTMDKISAKSLKIVGDVATALVTRQ